MNLAAFPAFSNGPYVHKEAIEVTGYTRFTILPLLVAKTNPPWWKAEIDRSTRFFAPHNLFFAGIFKDSLFRQARACPPVRAARAKQHSKRCDRQQQKRALVKSTDDLLLTNIPPFAFQSWMDSLFLTMANSPSRQKRSIADESEQLQQQNSARKSSRKSYSQKDARVLLLASGEPRGHHEALPSSSMPHQNQATAIIPIATKEKSPPLPPNTIVDMIQEMHTLLEEHENVRNLLFADGPEMSIIAGDEKEISSHETTVIAKAFTWQQILALKDDYKNEATNCCAGKAIVRLDGSDFHTTSERKAKTLDVVDNYLTDGEGRLMLPIDSLSVDAGGTKSTDCASTSTDSANGATSTREYTGGAGTGGMASGSGANGTGCMESGSSTASCTAGMGIDGTSTDYTNIATTTSATVGCTANSTGGSTGDSTGGWGVDSMSTDCTNVGTTANGTGAPEAKGTINGCVTSGNNSGKVCGTATDGTGVDSTSPGCTNVSTSKRTYHPREYCKDAALCIKLPIRYASCYFAIQASLELKAGILDKLGVDSAEKRYKQLVSTHLSVPFRLCIEYSKKKFANMPLALSDLVRKISAGAIGSYNRDGFGETTNDTNKPAVANSTTGLTNSQLLSALLQQKRQSLPDSEGKEPAAISQLFPELGERTKIEEVLDLALEKILELESNKESENSAKSQPPHVPPKHLDPSHADLRHAENQFRSSGRDSSRFRRDQQSPSHARDSHSFRQHQQSPSLGRDSPGRRQESPSPRRPQRPAPPLPLPPMPERQHAHPPDYFPAPPIPRKIGSTFRTLTESAAILYEQWGPGYWRTEIPDEVRITHLAGDMRASLTRCICDYMHEHGFTPSSHLGTNVTTLQRVLTSEHHRAMQRFKRLLDDALHAECQTPTKEKLSNAANMFLWQDKDFWARRPQEHNHSVY